MDAAEKIPNSKLAEQWESVSLWEKLESLFLPSFAFSNHKNLGRPRRAGTSSAS